jgi:hypothetical protein
VRLATPSEVDVTVSLAAVADRLATDREGLAVPIPPVESNAAWAGVSPPRRGWEALGGLGSGTLHDQAREGIAEIAAGAPEGSGGHAVTRLRAVVWGRSFSEFRLPAGVAFAVEALAFASPGETAAVFRSGPWTRVSMARGHVLSRAALFAVM